MEFEKRKAATLAALSSTVTDKSPKGSLDTPIIPLLDAINHHPSYFTTSSCSGRISILSQPSSTSNLPKKKARGGSWLFVSHELADSDSIVSLLFPSDPNPDPTCPCDLVFRFEPLIVAIECKDLASAQNLVAAAIASGFRESGITSAGKRVIIAIRCSIRMEVPLGSTQKLMVSPEYVTYLVGVANEKMEANRKRTDGFFLALLGSGFAGSAVAGNGGQVLVNNGGDGGAECGVGGDCSFAQDPNDGSEGGGANAHIGSVGVPCCSLSTAQISIIGEPVEKLFLWGHSSCRMDNTLHQILVFGGFGGMGRHARKNDCFVLDPSCGEVEAIKVGVAPSPRLGHTSSLVGDCMFVIGGRADPVNILSDVWAFSTAKKEWRLLECTGSVLPPRHRHAATVVGSEIYVFGGLSNDLIYSSLHVLDTVTLQWRELPVNGEWPCARHSHSMVTYGSKILMFGGYNGEKALGDLYSFDVKTCQWKKEKTEGRRPHARFSHSMFVYKNYIGVIGGCPVKQHHHELALLDLELQTWKYVVLNSVGKYLFVRSTASVISDDLVIIGGGAACYAFGTKFSEPVKINLLPLVSLDNNILQLEMRKKLRNEGLTRARNDFEGLQSINALTLTESPNFNTGAGTTGVDDRQQVIDSHGVLRLAKVHAKLGKDTLKKFGWLDLGRKAYSQEDGMYICFPVTEIFCALFHEKQHHSEDSLESHESFSKGILLNELSSSTALGLLKSCGATILADDILELKRAPKSPFKIMSEAVTSLIQSKGLSEQLLEELPARWDRLGDILVLPVTSFKDSVWDSIAKELWPTVAKSLNARRLARQGRVAPTGTRDSTLEILVGENGWVDHCENGVHYSFDATKCMFSWGNLSEKLRMGRLECTDEVIVDLFAGIGYYVLPFLVRANAKLVYACEWNPHAVEALRHNLQANSVSNRCIVLEGDNQITAPKGVADRVCLGLLPTSESSWTTAVRALKKEGGVMHVHGNVKDTEEGLWTEHVRKSINEIATSQGYCWQVSIKHVQRVKWYAPHIRHLVADVSCRQIQR